MGTATNERHELPRPPEGSPARMATQAPTAPERPHKAAKRYIYAWGDGDGRGQRHHEGPARRQGRGPRRDDQGGPAHAARLHDHHGRLQRLFRRRRTAPRRPLGRRPRGDARGRSANRQGLRRPGEPAPRERPLRRQVLHARNDGHRPQPRPERVDSRRPGQAHRQRALRVGRVPPVHPDVRPDRDGREGRALRRAARGPQARPRQGCS